MTKVGGPSPAPPGREKRLGQLLSPIERGSQTASTAGIGPRRYEMVLAM